VTDNSNCPKCEATLPADAPEGGCPKCLLSAGLQSADDGDPAIAPDITAVAEQFPELELLSELGRGGMGIVYKARQKNLDRMVALKVLPREIVEGDGSAGRFEERFTREARALARLSHANIVGVHEFGEREGVYYFLMEYVDGANLRQAMRSGELTSIKALAFVPQICDALQYAHDKGVVHRDIKPENILVDKSGNVKIADFGIAKLVSRTADERTLTRQGLVMGTPHYMAPEQIERPTEVDHRADIYSLGVVLYEMLTGELPIGRFAPPSEKVHVDVRLDEVVLRALEKDADRRYQAVVDVKTGIGAAGEGPVQLNEHGDGYAKRNGATAGSERSTLALWGLLLPLLAVAVSIPASLLLSTLRTTEEDGSWSYLALTVPTAAGLAAITGAVFSIIALVRIRRSKGMLHGTWMAIVGLLLPLLYCFSGGVFAYHSLGQLMVTVPDDGAQGLIDETGSIRPARRLKFVNEATVELQVPAGRRDGTPAHMDLCGRGADGSYEIDGNATARGTSWPLSADHVFVVQGVTVTGDVGALSPTVHIGEVVVRGTDTPGTGSSWSGAVAIPAGEENSAYATVPGDGAASVVIKGTVLEIVDTSREIGSRTVLLVEDRTVTLGVDEPGSRIDLAGRVAGAQSGDSGAGFEVPDGHFFAIEKVTLRGAPSDGVGFVQVGDEGTRFDDETPPGETLWAGCVEFDPRTEGALWLRTADASDAEIDVFGRIYRVLEEE
jgi:predicted Ser/Thr protein kinase